MYKVSNDNGNSEQKIKINGELFRQPNVNVMVGSTPWENMKDDSVINDLMNNLCVTIDSPSCAAGMYYVGKLALTQPVVKNLNVNIEEKHQSELPVVNTLAVIAAKAVLDGKESVNVDMATALPAAYWNDNHARVFRDKFIGKHHVTVHVGTDRKSVDITFDFVAVIPESAAAIFEFHKMYPETKDERTFVVDVGDGTTDKSILEGKKLLKIYTNGIKHGAGFPIEAALKVLRKRPGLNKIKRQYVEEVIKGSDEQKQQYLEDVTTNLRVPLINETAEISNFAIEEMDACNNEFDNLAVIGGGSILMRPHLEKELKKATEIRKKKMYYIDSDKASLMNVLGLDNFLNSKTFEILKERGSTK